MQEYAGVLVGTAFHDAGLKKQGVELIQKFINPAAMLSSSVEPVLSKTKHRTIHRSVILLSLSKYQDFQAFIRDLYIDYVFHLC